MNRNKQEGGENTETENVAVCFPLFCCGGRHGGGGVFQSAGGNLPWGEPGDHHLVLRPLSNENFGRGHGMVQLLSASGRPLVDLLCLRRRAVRSILPAKKDTALDSRHDVRRVLFAATDEYHQFLTGDRTATPKDVLLDACGVALGCILTYVVVRKLRKKRTQ